MTDRGSNISEVRINAGANTSDVNIFSPLAAGNLFFPYVQDAADDTFVSLTIDILNKNEIKEQEFYNESLINTQRDREYFPSAEDKWGFIESSNQNSTTRSIANAFCFCGQKIQFYIAVKDQDAGYFDNQFVYCKTALTISVVDIVSGDETVLKTFEDFELESDDSDRYFTWEVPSCNMNLFNEYGVFGIHVLRLDIARTFFTDSELTIHINNLYPYRNQWLLQLLTYSAPIEALNVDSSTVTWLKDKTFSPIADIEDIFNHSLISDLEDINIPLSDDQKRAIIADQIAFLFIAQHPTITADNYPSHIVGLGVNANLRSETVINRIQTYSRKYPKIVEFTRSRLFGILATYQKYNFIKDIESCFDDYAQSLQTIRDPVKTIFIDRSGNLQTSFGSSGMLLNPYVITTTEADLPSDVILETTAEITFRKSDVDIEDVRVTNIDGTPISQDTRYALVSFDIVSGSDEIARIRYTLWTSNNLNMFEYVDEDGTSRYHVFDCETFGNIIYTSTTGEILFTRIDIEDKNGFTKSFYGEQFLFDEGPGFTTIETFQRQDGGGMVDIYYDYFGTSEINNSKIVVYTSSDGTSWTEVTSDKLRGDFGIAVMPGRNHIVWEPVKPGTVEDFGNYILVKITLYDINKQDNKGKDSNISVVRFDRSVVAIRRLTREEEEEMWRSSSSSSSSTSSYSSSSSSSSTSSSSTSSSSSSTSSSSSIDSSSSSSSEGNSSSSSLFDDW